MLIFSNFLSLFIVAWIRMKKYSRQKYKINATDKVYNITLLLGIIIWNINAGIFLMISHNRQIVSTIFQSTYNIYENTK